MKRRCQNGLTLIELLAVLAVMGVLMASLFPALLQARQAAFRGRCTGNLRQLGTAFRQYLDDYDGGFPPNGVAYIQDIHQVDQLWYRQLRPYLRDEAVLHCPADNVTNARRSLSNALPDEQDRPDLPALSYGANWILVEGAARGDGRANEASIDCQALTLLLADCTEPWAFGPVYTDSKGVRWSHIAYANGPAVFDPPSFLHGGRSGMGHERHGTGSFIAYMDGHVGFMPATHFYRATHLLRTGPEGNIYRVSVQRPLIAPGAIPPPE